MKKYTKILDAIAETITGRENDIFTVRDETADVKEAIEAAEKD